MSKEYDPFEWVRKHNAALEAYKEGSKAQFYVTQREKYLLRIVARALVPIFVKYALEIDPKKWAIQEEGMLETLHTEIDRHTVVISD